jgi:tetratricopeptide (TPR) repeat protein
MGYKMRPLQQAVWTLCVLALLFAAWQVPFASLVHRQAGTRAFLQAIVQVEQMSNDYGWPVAVEPEAERVKQAQRHLTQVGALPDRNAYRTIGLIELASGDVPEAQRWLQRRIEASPDDVLARFFLGETLLRSGDTWGAIEEWGAAGAKAPLRRLADTLIEDGRPQEALLALDFVSRLDPDLLDSRQKAAELVEEYDPQQALARYEEIMAVAPEHHAAYARAGRILLQEGQYERAALLFEQSLEREPARTAWIRELLGQAYAALGDLDRAIDSYKKAIREDPARYRPYEWLADALCQQGRPGQARSYYEQTIQRGNPGQHPQQALEYIIAHGQCPPD